MKAYCPKCKKVTHCDLLSVKDVVKKLMCYVCKKVFKEGG
jgi:hypothetical protein